MNTATRKAMKQANKALYELGQTYHGRVRITRVRAGDEDEAAGLAVIKFPYFKFVKAEKEGESR